MEKKPTRPTLVKDVSSENSASKKVISLSDARAQRSDQERRRIERFFLKDIVQVFCVMDNNKELLPIELIEAGEGGCSFRAPLNAETKPFELGHEFSFRIYLSRDTFLLLGVRIVSANPMADEGHKYMRYGCAMDASFASYPAYQQLMKFIETYSSVCRKEKEKNSVSGPFGR